MTIKHTAAAVLLTIAGLISAAALTAQSTAAPPTDAAAEIRAMRVEINDRLEANIRVQLLVARLQLQEQRTGTVIRELQGVEEKLRQNQQSRDQIETGLKMFGGMAALEDATNDDNFMFGMFRKQVQHVTQLDAELKAQQAQLTSTLAEEQARWAAFNARLDEIEKMFTKR